MELVESGVNGDTEHPIIIGYKANRMVCYRRNRVLGGSYFFTVTFDVKQVKDWPHSSFYHFVAKIIYPLNWGCANNDTFDQYRFGE